MADKLGYVEPWKSHEPWGIAWFCDGEEGGHIGECYDATKAEPPRSDDESWQQWTIERAALPFCADGHDHRNGFKFENQAMARKAMAAIKLALKATRPLFDWENKALAAGWKPPKGWTGAA